MNLSCWLFWQKLHVWPTEKALGKRGGWVFLLRHADFHVWFHWWQMRYEPCRLIWFSALKSAYSYPPPPLSLHPGILGRPCCLLMMTDAIQSTVFFIAFPTALKTPFMHHSSHKPTSRRPHLCQTHTRRTDVQMHMLAPFLIEQSRQWKRHEHIL